MESTRNHSRVIMRLRKIHDTSSIAIEQDQPSRAAAFSGR